MGPGPWKASRRIVYAAGYMPPLLQRLPDLPVRTVLPDVAAALAANRTVVLQAPPGSGKTTLTAPALLDAPWLAGRRILLLEPRRLAARAAARYMARLLGEEVGGTVGYSMRLERRVGRDTRIEVLTEGLLATRVLADPELADTALVIFDEFHERSLAADFGLALALDVRRALRPDLRLLAMSATLDAEPLARHLDGAAVVTATARSWPVETRLQSRPPPEPWHLPRHAASAVRQVLADEAGSILVFLPGIMGSNLNADNARVWIDPLGLAGGELARIAMNSGAQVSKDGLVGMAYVIGNEDDPILNERELAYLKEVFGERGVFFPRGGHCGNLQHVAFAQKMLEIIRK